MLVSLRKRPCSHNCGNIRFDLTELGIADLARLVSTDPRLNADTVCINFKVKKQPKDEHKNNVAIFANEIENQLSLPSANHVQTKKIVDDY